MSSTTTNYNLHKIDLTDSPPDITVLNQNFDIIDEKLNEHDNLTASDVGARPDTWTPTASQVGALSDKGGTLSGNLKLLRGNSPTIEMKVLSDNGYTSMYQHGGTFTTSSGMSSDSDESFMVLTKPSEDDDSSIFRIGRTINNSSKYYKLYGEHNKPTASDVGALQLNSFDAISQASGHTIMSRITGLVSDGIYCGRFQSNDNIADNPEENWAFAIEFYKVENIYYITACKMYEEVYYERQLDVGAQRYITDWMKYDTSANYLPLDGSVPMSGYFAIINNKWRETNPNARLLIETLTSGYVGFYNELDSSNYAGVRLKPITADATNISDVLQFRVKNNKVSNTYVLYGAHNKPSGLYTGNGSATTRTINTGGIGSVCVVYSDYSIAIVSKGGAIVRNESDALGITSSLVKFVDGVLTIATTGDSVNYNGVVYQYQVL